MILSASLQEFFFVLKLSKWAVKFNVVFFSCSSYIRLLNLSTGLLIHNSSKNIMAQNFLKKKSRNNKFVELGNNQIFQTNVILSSNFISKSFYWSICHNIRYM